MGGEPVVTGVSEFWLGDAISSKQELSVLRNFFAMKLGCTPNFIKLLSVQNELLSKMAQPK